MRRKGLKLGSRRDDQRVGWLFILPFLVGFVFLFMDLIIRGFSYAFSEVQPGETGIEMTFSGWGNFRQALRVDPRFFQILLRTLQEMLTLIPMVLIFSLFVSVILNGKIWCRTFFRAVFFLPVIVTTGLISRLDAGNAVMQYMANAASASADAELGLNSVSLFLQSMKFSPGLISAISGVADSITELITLSGVQILLFLAGLQSISPSVYEAADVEGASGWEKFWKITLPMVLPIGVVCLFYSLIDYLTRDNTTIMTYIKNKAFEGGEFGQASAMAWIYCFCVTVLLLIGFGIAYAVRRNSRRNEQR